MGWTDPRTWIVGEIVTKATMDAHVKDNLRYLKGLDGVPTIQAGLVIGTTGGNEYLRLPLLTTAQIGTILSTATATGRVAYDNQANVVKFYDGTAVRSVISTADVHDTPVNGSTINPISSNWAFDHLNLLTGTGDIPYSTGTGIWNRLGLGTAGQRLSVNVGTTAPQWQTVTGIAIAVGTYTGNSVDNHAIAHGLGIIPKLVNIHSNDASYGGLWALIQGAASIVGVYYAAGDALMIVPPVVTAMDNANFYVGSAAGSANLNTINYYWCVQG